MFDKDAGLIPYHRKDYTLAEELYEEYIKMRRAAHQFEKIKYPTKEDTFIGSKEGKEGFIAGVHAMLSLMADL